MNPIAKQLSGLFLLQVLGFVGARIFLTQRAQRLFFAKCYALRILSSQSYINTKLCELYVGKHIPKKNFASFA